MFTKLPKAINDGVDLAITDVHEAADREADGDTYPQYCVGVAPTPPPTTDTTVGPFEFEFGEICTGAPTASIDVTGLKMWQETDTFRMNNFMVTNTSACVAYFATQLKLWPLIAAVPAQPMRQNGQELTVVHGLRETHTSKSPRLHQERRRKSG
jgi:hypothetical protein